MFANLPVVIKEVVDRGVVSGIASCNQIIDRVVLGRAYIIGGRIRHGAIVTQIEAIAEPVFKTSRKFDFCKNIPDSGDSFFIAVIVVNGCQRIAISNHFTVSRSTIYPSIYSRRSPVKCSYYIGRVLFLNRCYGQIGSYFDKIV